MKRVHGIIAVFLKAQTPLPPNVSVSVEPGDDGVEPSNLPGKFCGPSLDLGGPAGRREECKMFM